MTVPRAVAVVGATASGKSALAHAVALECGGDVEILCVDAMSVYRGMDLATAKPSRRERELVAYHLLDLVDASDEYSLEEFQRAARRAAKEVRARGHRVLYVGGTGLYGRAVIDDLEIPGRYPTIRATLDARAASELPALYAELTALDPLAASRMEPTNERRILRALEVTLGAGRPFSSFGAGLSAYPPSTVAQVGLRVELAELDRRVEARFRRWLDEGLLDEIRNLTANPAGISKTARQAVGYRQLLAHVEDGVDLETCVRDALIQSRRLARRQRSWFERDPRIEWFDDPRAAHERVATLLSL
ncbi:MAG: tRNA (adenosine(37)-N6)-dimethylallyltransferase MiaA [Acidobacteriota bacterium]|nr:tRNA (adenosine(37)-N6)-dimethylallyltransferase MiaA [Acidobacteriota bacterium]MDE3107324.1 tRNA (adenosine(37)-N6)-dimethylallyltransferase MiaA [Acidobacteriota bacterium]